MGEDAESRSMNDSEKGSSVKGGDQTGIEFFMLKKGCIFSHIIVIFYLIGDRGEYRVLIRNIIFIYVSNA